MAEAADLLVNISGHLTLDALKPRFRARAFIDLDPGYTQYWHAQGLAEDRLRDHHAYFTVGENIGTPDCDVPTDGIAWRPIRQPVVLDEWPVCTADEATSRFTTVASWRGPYGRVTHDGRTLGLKAHEFRKFVDAADADRARLRDRARRRSRGSAGRRRAPAPRLARRRSARPSRAIRSRSGATSSNRPPSVPSRRASTSRRAPAGSAIARCAISRRASRRSCRTRASPDTYPTGRGLVAFRTLDEAARGADLIMRDYEAHARAARAIAEDWFDSDKVLTDLLRTHGSELMMRFHTQRSMVRRMARAAIVLLRSRWRLRAGTAVTLAQQAGTSRLHGTVTDQTGGVVIGA